MRNILKKLLAFLLVFIGVFNVLNITFADALDDAFDDAKDYTVQAENENTEIVTQSVIVKATKFLLKTAVALSVTMIMYGGLMTVLSVGDESKMIKARDNIMMVGIGLMIALSSVAIITMINSITEGGTLDSYKDNTNLQNKQIFYV